MEQITSHPAFICIIGFLCSIIVACIISPYMVKLAYKKNLVDVPNHRKLQSRPVPVIGGVCIYFALMSALFIVNSFVHVSYLFVIVTGVSVVFFVGFFDDMMSLPAVVKFFLQIAVIVLFWYSSSYRIDNLCGVFGINKLSVWIGLPFSVLVGVGLMNAFNMIDGVNGLASGLSIFANIIFSVIFLSHGYTVFAGFTFIILGALLPFFICNVFSRKYKMFLGDAGSLIMGLLAYIYVCKILHTKTLFDVDVYKVAGLLAIYSVPVFDTLRVMLMRIIKGKSPFNADKTHIHHIFIDIRIPHLFVTLIIISMNFIVWLIVYLLTLTKMDVTLHFALAIIVSLAVVWGSYFILNSIKNKNAEMFERIANDMQSFRKGIVKYSIVVGYFLDGHYFHAYNRRIKKYDNKLENRIDF